MPPRLNLLHTPRTLVLRPKTSPPRCRSFNGPASQMRSYSDAKDTKDPRSEGAEKSHNLHVSEEAAAIAKAKGETPPDIEQGTPVEEVVKGDKEAEKSLPKVMQEKLKQQKSSGTRSFSTMARKPNSTRSFSTLASRQAGLEMTSSGAPGFSVAEGAMLAGDLMNAAPAKKPHARVRHLHNRYQTIVEQMVGLMIQDGKKAAAQRNVSLVLAHLRTSPAPKLDSARLIPGHPPSTHLPLDPVAYLQLAIDSVAPIMRIKNLKGAAGGGMALAVPVPLGLRRRRWEAFHWVLDAAAKKKNRGSGKNMFAQRVAEEIVAIVEGRSGAWQKRDALHKQAVVARANMPTGTMRR